MAEVQLKGVLVRDAATVALARKSEPHCVYEKPMGDQGTLLVFHTNHSPRNLTPPVSELKELVSALVENKEYSPFVSAVEARVAEQRAEAAATESVSEDE